MKRKLYIVTGICRPSNADESPYLLEKPIVRQTLEEAQDVFRELLEGLAEEAQTQGYTYSTHFDGRGTTMFILANHFTDTYEISEVEVDF
jgi:hypothetical protein